jgi:hypothetical protein
VNAIDDDSQLHASGAARTEPTSLGAVAIDTNRRPETKAASTTQKESEESAFPELPPRRAPLAAKVLFGLVVGGCAVVLSLSVSAVRHDLAVKHARDAAMHAAMAPAPVVPAVLAAPIPATAKADVATSPAPAPAPQADEKAKTATIRLGKKAHALKVDGKPVKGDTAEVSCGAHLVAVDKEKPRRVEAVCGRTLIVDDKKAKLLPDGPPKRKAH